MNDGGGQDRFDAQLASRADGPSRPSRAMSDVPAREPVRFLVFSASLREGSLNTRLARLAARVIEADGGEVDLATMAEFDIKGMDAFFIYAPDTRIAMHPIRIAMDGYTAVTGVIKGTFTEPMPDGDGSSIAPTGRGYSLNMATIARWNEHGVMTEEWLYWDNQTFMQ
jgi:hypothetical protein